MILAMKGEHPVEPDPHGLIAPRVRWLAFAAGALCVLVLFGWHSDIDVLTRLVPGLPTMKANTALAFLLLSVSVWRVGAGHRRVPLLGAPLALALALLTLVQWPLSVDLGIDDWLLRDLATPPQQHPGRMALATSAAVVLLGIATLAVRAKATTVRAVGHWACIAAMTLGYAASVGLLTHVTWSGWAGLVLGSVSLPTTTVVLLLATALLQIDGWSAFARVGTIHADGFASHVVRICLPACLLGPTVVAWLLEAGLRGAQASEVQAISSIALGLLFALLALASAGWISRLEADLRQTHAQHLENERRAKLAAEAALQLRSEQIGQISHELRTPLNAIIGLADLMSAGTKGALAPDHHRWIDLIRQAGHHMLRTIADLVELRRVEAGLEAPVIAPVDALGIARSVAELLSEEAAKVGVSVSVQHRDDAGPVMADARRLRQVLINLISNAIKYNRAGGTVGVRLEPGGAAQLAIRVEDSGLGIEPSHMARLFEPFYRAGRENSAVEGSGLGLALARSLVTGMGGQLEVASGPGRGSMFSVVLPAAGAQ